MSSTLWLGLRFRETHCQNMIARVWSVRQRTAHTEKGRSSLGCQHLSQVQKKSHMSVRVLRRRYACAWQRTGGSTRQSALHSVTANTTVIRVAFIHYTPEILLSGLIFHAAGQLGTWQQWGGVNSAAFGNELSMYPHSSSLSHTRQACVVVLTRHVEACLVRVRRRT